MEEIKEIAKLQHIPIIRDQTAEALVNLCKEVNPRKVLEIGTAIGYSGLLILGSCDCMLTTIEKDANRISVARENFQKYCQAERIELIEGDAKEILSLLAKKREKYDLIFLDGAKGQYIHYYDDIKSLLGSGGVLFADNVLLQGMVKLQGEIPHKHRSMVVNMRKFLDRLKKDQDYQTEIFEIEDGYSISKLK